jgi:predicted dehydrogenase
METIDLVNLGVIGCGYWGPNLVRNFVELPTSDVMAVADRRDERLKYIQKRYPKVITTTEYQGFFSMPLNAAVVATNASTHYQIARDCLQHDLPVLIEKPITMNSHEAEELIRIAEERSLILMAGHTFEYNAAVQELKKIIESGELGRIYYVDAVRANLGPVRDDVSALWDLASHDVSILLYILGLEPTSVYAQGGAYLSKDKQDVTYIHLTFPDGVLAHIHASWLNPCKVRRITVVGSKKMAVFDDVDPQEKIRIYDKGAEVLPYTNTFADFQISYRYGDVVIPHIPFVEPLRVECQHFVDCVMNHTEPRTNGRIGYKVVKILEAAERSLQNGGNQEKIVFGEAYA